MKAEALLWPAGCPLDTFLPSITVYPPLQALSTKVYDSTMAIVHALDLLDRDGGED